MANLSHADGERSSNSVSITLVKDTGIHDRLVAVVGNRTYRELSQLTGIHHETVRRFLSGQAPSAEFLHALCRTMKVNAHWLLMGVGPKGTGDIRPDALRQADPSELLAAMAEAIERLIDRVDLIERFVQTLETRLRANGADHDRKADIRVQAGERGGTIGEAIPERAHRDDG